MTAYALTVGKLRRGDETRTSSKTGKPFTIASVRDLDPWWSGPFTAAVYAKDGGSPHLNLRIVADRIASPRFSRRKEVA